MRHATAESAVQAYLDGFFLGDATALTGAMLPECRLTSVAGDGTVIALSRDEFVAAVTVGPSLQARGVTRRDRIEFITTGSPVTALARVHDVDAETDYTDELTLLRTSGGWGIISKSWHGVVRGAGIAK
ncbi:hypothetical protein QE410_001099 [Microbacterium sp. SORGH_AS 1204]|uniref:nuclear transport factor 2 family protein n=1 Tax=Microbacterium sp. SORGH_AS_1204 TaxID=3041785 RepID=UPI00278CAC7D|nr:nuclear transport factor 2 family protein [Microbacterium sp. SORGH_AS_1204]MDQ1136300.1 hypothetical protein [Microbacterium sp. SORGH_AS_1204]